MELFYLLLKYLFVCLSKKKINKKLSESRKINSFIKMLMDIMVNRFVNLPSWEIYLVNYKLSFQ